MNSNRRKSRELAVQILYSFHSNLKPMDQVFEDPVFVKSPEGCRDYAVKLAEGCTSRRQELDAVISDLSHNWKLARIELVDSIILRIALFEMIYLGDVPAPVAINEAIDLAKKFSSDKSGKFINGILDAYNRSRQ